MSLTIRTELGRTEAVIDPQGGLRRFYQVAGILSDYFQVAFTGKDDEFDAINWHFSLGKHRLTLQFSIYNGIMLFPTNEQSARRRENKAVEELASVIEGKLMSLDMKPAT